MNKKGTFRVSVVVLSCLFIGLFISCGTTNPPANVDTSKTTTGSLAVSTSTKSNGGKYAPSHILAIWVENSSGQYVKTLLVYAAQRKSDLTNWTSNSAGNTTDAITSATQSSHTTRTCAWNGKDAKGNVVANGIYKLCMELSDTNGTGTFKTFEFAKDTIATTIKPAAASSFSNISIVWTPN